MTLADTGGDGGADQVVQVREVVGQVVARQRGLDCGHAAADVDADRGRDDRRLGRDDAADRRSLADVRVGHESQRGHDERHRRGRARLRQRRGPEGRGPGQDGLVVGEDRAHADDARPKLVRVHRFSGASNPDQRPRSRVF